MFNAAYAITGKSAQDTIDLVNGLLTVRGFRTGKQDRDISGTLQLRATDEKKGPFMKRIFHMLPGGTGETHRTGVEVAVLQGEEIDDENDKGESLLYISVYPLMELFDLPGIPGVTETERERLENEERSREVFEELCKSLKEMLKGTAEEVFHNVPLRKRYSLPVEKSPPLVELQESIVEFLKDTGFSVIRIGKSGGDRTIHIKAMNQSKFHAMKEVLMAGWFSRYLDKTQRVAAELQIIPPDTGKASEEGEGNGNTGEGEKGNGTVVTVSMYPAMEFFDIEEVPGLSESLDEELTDAKLCGEMWEKLTASLEENLGLTEQKS